MPSSRPPRLLIADASTESWDGLLDRFRTLEYEAELVDEPDAALKALRGDSWSVLLAAAGGPVDFLDEALKLAERPEVILFDDFGTLDDAVDALRLGAFDCISRPTSEEQILLSVQRALGQRDLARENRRLREEVGERFALADVESRDAAMRRVFQVLEAVADTRATLLLLGESGTGKTALARAVHHHSDRRAAPFVEVNCGALPAALLESELFGHARGAFTGAERDHPGKFEQAHGGTLFLDEIATATADLQVKLLRVLQDRRFERVGDPRTIEVDVRVIAATNMSLAGEVAAGRFREDLFYRLQVVSVEVPPLRARPSDVLFLAERFRARYAAEYERDVRGLTSEAKARLAAHSWPGNVRQLEHAVERAVLLAAGPLVVPGDLGPDLGAGPPPEPPDEAPDEARTAAEELPLGPLRKALEIPERRLLVRALEATGGCRKRAADLLEINRTTLFNKMRKYNLLDFPTGQG